MLSPHSTPALTPQYTTAIEALSEAARTSLFLGQLENAQHVLRTALRLQETGEVAPRDQFKLLLWYGRVLNVAHLIHQGEPEILLATVQQARHLAETTRDQQNLADALSLLGQARCNATTVALLKRGALPFGAQDQGYT